MQQITEEHRRIIIIIICTTKMKQERTEKYLARLLMDGENRLWECEVFVVQRVCSRRQDKKLVAKYGM